MNVIESISPAVIPETAVPEVGAARRSTGFERMLARAIEGEAEQRRPDSGQANSREQRRSAESDTEPGVQGTPRDDHRQSGQGDTENTISVNPEESDTTREESPNTAEHQEQIKIILGEHYETTLPLEIVSEGEFSGIPALSTDTEMAATIPASSAGAVVNDPEGGGITIVNTTSGEIPGLNPEVSTGVLTLNTDQQIGPVANSAGDMRSPVGISPTQMTSPEVEIPGLTDSKQGIGEGVDTRTAAPPVSHDNLKPDPLQNQSASLESRLELTGTSEMPDQNQDLTKGIDPSLTAGPRSALTAETKYQLDGRPVIKTDDETGGRALESGQSNKPPRPELTAQGANTREPVLSGGKQENVEPISELILPGTDPGKGESSAKENIGSKLTGGEPLSGTGREQVAFTAGNSVSGGPTGATAVFGEPAALKPMPEISLDRIPRETFRIVETMTREGERIFETTMRLNPPELGQMRLEVKLENDKLAARFIVDNAVARQQLEMEIPRLRAILESQGLEEAQIEVQIELGNSDSWREQQDDGAGDQSGWGENGDEQDWQGLAGQGEASTHDGLIDLRA